MESMQQLDDAVSVEIAKALTGLQGGRSDTEFAGLLGCTRTHWSHIRSGKRRPSYALVKRAVSHFPQLYPIVMRDLTAARPVTVEAAL